MDNYTLGTTVEILYGVHCGRIATISAIREEEPKYRVDLSCEVINGQQYVSEWYNAEGLKRCD